MIRQFSVGKQQPIQLLDMVPAGSTIINTSSTDTVWCSGNPGVATNNGFPIQPLSSMEKPKDGPLWAILDSSATGVAATILVGDDLSGYSDPIALAAAVALQLSQTGIPSKILLDFIASFPNLAPLDGTPLIDVSQYRSLLIQFSVVAGSDLPAIECRQFSPAIPGFGPVGSIMASDFLCGNDAGIFSGIFEAFGSQIEISNLSGSILEVKVWGSNRDDFSRVDTQFSTGLGDVYTLTGGVTSGIPVRMVQRTSLNNGSPYGFYAPKLQGRCTMYTRCGGTTKGRFELRLDNGSVVSWLLDTAEMTISSSSSLIDVREVSLPLSRYELWFIPTATVANVGTIALHFIPN